MTESFNVMKFIDSYLTKYVDIDEVKSKNLSKIVEMLDETTNFPLDNLQYTYEDVLLDDDIALDLQRKDTWKRTWSNVEEQFEFISYGYLGYLYKHKDFYLLAFNQMGHPTIISNTYSFGNSDGSTDFNDMFFSDIEKQIEFMQNTILRWLFMPEN